MGQDTGLVARSEPRELASSDGHMVREWRVRRLSEDEYMRLLDNRTITDSERGRKWVLEVRRVDEIGGQRKPWNWEIHDFGYNKEDAVDREGSSDYAVAESLDPAHANMKAVRKEREESEEALQELKNKLGDLTSEVEREYHSELKKRKLYSAALENRAPADVVKELKEKYQMFLGDRTQNLRGEVSRIEKRLVILKKGKLPTAPRLSR